MVDKEWIEEYKNQIIDLWHSEYPDEGEPQANVQDVIMEQLRAKNKRSLNNQLVSLQVDEMELEELNEMVLAALAGEHFANKPY